MEFDKIINDTLPTLVEFYKPGCEGCEQMQPVVEKLKDKYAGKAHIVSINGEAEPQLKEKYHIHSYPTWIIFRDGQEAWRDGGRKPLSELEDMIGRFS